MSDETAKVTVVLAVNVLERARMAAQQDRRSLSQWCAMALERALEAAEQREVPRVSAD